MWISWLFKINYFNNMSPHYKHIYLCHPPFKHLSPVSDMYEAKLEASRQALFLSSPSFRSSESSPVTEWSFPVLLSFPIPLFLLMMLSLITYSPSSSLFSYSTSLLSALFCRQYLSETKILKSPNNLKFDQVFKVMTILLPMICYDVWLEHSPPHPPGRPSNRLTFTTLYPLPSNRLTFTMTPTFQTLISI